LPQSTSNTTTIDASSKITLSDLKELFAYKDLVYFLVKRDVRIVYKQTILGFAWAVLQPLVSMVVFTIFFGKLAGFEKDMQEGTPYVLFSYVALVPWTYFSSALNASANSLVSEVNLLGKVYFPRVILPLIPVIARLVNFIISFAILVVLFLIYDWSPFANRIIYLPLMTGMLVFTVFGAGLWLSALTIEFRDTKFIINFLIQLLLFASPIIWPIKFIPEAYQTIYALNPLVGIIEGFREAIIGNSQMPWDLIKMSSLSSVVIFVSGLWYFKKREDYFADVA